MGNQKSSQVEPASSEKEYGQPFKFDPNEAVGPVKKRSCTDILCLGLFLAFLGGWGFVAYFGMSKGDITKVKSSGASLISRIFLVVSIR